MLLLGLLLGLLKISAPEIVCYYLLLLSYMLVNKTINCEYIFFWRLQQSIDPLGPYVTLLGRVSYLLKECDFCDPYFL